MEFLQYVFPSPVGGVRSSGLFSPACETHDGRSSQETKRVDERDWRDPPFPWDCPHEFGNVAEFGGDPHRFRPSELCPGAHPTRDKDGWKDSDNVGSLEGVMVLSHKGCRYN